MGRKHRNVFLKWQSPDTEKGACFTFWYYMYGRGVQELKVQYIYDKLPN